jgi:arginine/ornithine N-succinyltransferase beta subunit
VLILDRTFERQQLHDKCIENVAKNLNNEGFTVEADIENWNRPPAINGYIPDIRAVRDGLIRIYEVETVQTLDEDVEQQRTFQKYSDEEEVFFFLYLANNIGECEQIK